MDVIYYIYKIQLHIFNVYTVSYTYIYIYTYTYIHTYIYTFIHIPWLSKDIKRIVQGPRLFKTIYFQYTRYSRVVSCQPNLITKPRQADVVLGHANVKIIMIVKENIMGIMMTKTGNPWKSHKQLELYCYIVDPYPKYKPLVLFSQILQRYWVQLPWCSSPWLMW